MLKNTQKKTIFLLLQNDGRIDMEDFTLQVANGQTPKVLLMGNGINRAFGFASWDDLIESVRIKDLSEAEKEGSTVKILFTPVTDISVPSV